MLELLFMVIAVTLGVYFGLSLYHDYPQVRQLTHETKAAVRRLLAARNAR